MEAPTIAILTVAPQATAGESSNPLQHQQHLLVLTRSCPCPTNKFFRPGADLVCFASPLTKDAFYENSISPFVFSIRRRSDIAHVSIGEAPL